MPWSIIAVIALVVGGLFLSIWFAWHQHQHHKRADAAALDGHRLTAGSVRVDDRHEVQLVDESTGRVVARLDPGDAGRLADELVTAAARAHTASPEPDDGEDDDPFLDDDEARKADEFDQT